MSQWRPTWSSRRADIGVPWRAWWPTRRSELAWWAVLACAVVAGVWLRSTQLSTQILIDDEWHAIHRLLASGEMGIATTFGLADFSIPLTLYYRFLAVHGGLTEWEMRSPLLGAGVAILLLAPWLLRRQAPLPVLATWCALLAIYLSRTARPYALTCLLTFVAVVAFRHWWRSEDQPAHSGALYVVATFLAGWLHLIALPFTLLPFLYYGARSVLRPARMNEPRLAQLRRLLVLAIATALPLALGAPFINDWGSLVQRSRRRRTRHCPVDRVASSAPPMHEAAPVRDLQPAARAAFAAYVSEAAARQG